MFVLQATPPSGPALPDLHPVTPPFLNLDWVKGGFDALIWGTEASAWPPERP